MKDLNQLVEWASYFIENYEIVDAQSFELVIRFFQLSSKCLIREKSFDDKIYFHGIGAALKFTAMIVDTLSQIFD